MKSEPLTAKDKRLMFGAVATAVTIVVILALAAVGIGVLVGRVN